MNNITVVDLSEDEINPIKELADNMEQLTLIVSRGELSASAIVADYYKPIECDGRVYRTHAIMVDVME